MQEFDTSHAIGSRGISSTSRMLCKHSKNISRLLLSCDRISIKLQLTGKSRLISQLKLTFFAPWYIKEFLTILRQFRYFSRFPKATKDDVMSVSSGLPELCIFFQQIMRYFLANYALKIQNYVRIMRIVQYCTIFLRRNS